MKVSFIVAIVTFLEIKKLYTLLGDHKIMDLLDWPELSDSTYSAIAAMLNKCLTAAYFLDMNLTLFLAAKVVIISIIHGNSTYSCFTYVMYGLLEKSKYHVFDKVVDWGILGITLCERYSQVTLMADRGQVWNVYGGKKKKKNKV